VFTACSLEGGLEEVVEEFSGSHVQYGFIRVTDPNHGTSKFVLVNWTGEGAPPERKGLFGWRQQSLERSSPHAELCANHHRDVATFFSVRRPSVVCWPNVTQGAHVTLNARSEADLDVDAIKKLVAKSSGANYSVHKEKPNAKYAADAPTPVTSSFTNSYKTEGAAPSTERDKFWHQQEVPCTGALSCSMTHGCPGRCCRAQERGGGRAGAREAAGGGGAHRTREGG
jgi:hypothetical protein